MRRSETVPERVVICCDVLQREAVSERAAVCCNMRESEAVGTDCVRMI